MTACMIEAVHDADREARADSCPNCSGVLTTNQDGWKVCYSCGYSAPGYAPAPADPAAGSVAALN